MTVSPAVERAFDAAVAAAKASRSSKFLKWIDEVPTFAMADGAPVPADVIKGWMAQAIKAEVPTGSVEADAALNLLAPDDAARLSLWVLERWLAFDCARPSDVEATKKAKAAIRKDHGFYVSHHGIPAQLPDDLTQHPYFEGLKARAMKKYANSGFSSRGVLALARRAPGRQAALAVGTFIERHGRRHGTRSAQGKIALHVLAHIADQNCLEVLSTAFVGLHEGLAHEAAMLLEQIRTRRKWTWQQLGDRAVSNAGLDADLGVDLPWGHAPYRAQVQDDLTMILINPQGRSVKALPTAKDPSQKDTKKLLIDVKKNIAATMTAQTARLYAEMCHDRVWTLADWQTFIVDHPILSRLSQRLVWTAQTTAGRQTFRPTAEGDFSDVADMPVRLDQTNGISLAHRVTVDAETATAWQRHLADYEVTALFDQFARPPVHRADLPRLSGHDLPIPPQRVWGPDLLKNAKLLGYAAPGTGKTFFEFPDLVKEIGAFAISLSTYGSPPSHPDHAAIQKVSVTQNAADIPPVLLSEITNDLKVMLGREDIFTGATS
ncbi:DUF4132 domain-containing protein [Actibacterium sp. 188UL27-1]|uniref:DUF4132 domain-containing protein n=1 Tax=Actibacterium sp. 188UL27-1 TaxID=2786961 RepID=UPI00195D87C9|nr:DUF4132 domain-containing protein [Actibacterium sp. 188UL27-1]MBM7070293.1 DUF4132 domain-containing protein [Actibacterium sp. 188UL27-1]